MTLVNRRTFMLGAGLAAASGFSPESRPALGQMGVRSQKALDLPSIIGSERKRILDAMKEHDIPGAAVCLIHDGKPVWVEGMGVTDRRTNRSVAADTIFSIQSTSKNVTAVGIMLAVQHGILDLDEPIITYVPDFIVQSRFEPLPQKKMTLRLLLAHRAGFTHEAPVGNNYDPASPSFDAHVHSISQTWLRFPVGERYRYSNLGFDLAGYILQVRSGMPFEQWIKTMVFDPLGMKDSTVATDVYTERANRALGHAKGYSAVPMKTPLIPSGGVYMSARDIAAFSIFHLNRGTVDGRTILKEQLWEEMHGFAFGNDYSLGVIRTELRHGSTPLRLLNHQGGGFGFGSVFYYCPEASLAWAALFNRPASAAYRFGKRLIDDSLTLQYGTTKPRLPVGDLASIQLPAAWQENYVGNYIARNFSADLKIKDGRLGLQAGTTLTPIGFISPDEVFTADPDESAVTYRYYVGSSNEPAHLECFIGENSLDYNDAPHNVAGPDKPAWAQYLGVYHIDMWGIPSETVTIHRKNGYLYLNSIRLIIELEPGLFFTSDGETVDFRSNVPTWKNIRLRRASRSGRRAI
jgi:CubicO group peptidase (beta-lactamase class C family)